MLGAWVCVGVKENRDKDGVKTHKTNNSSISWRLKLEDYAKYYYYFELPNDKFFDKNFDTNIYTLTIAIRGIKIV